MQSCTLYVTGMHCASCELLIERELAELAGISDVDADLTTNRVNFRTDNSVNLAQLNAAVNEYGYTLSEQPDTSHVTRISVTNWLTAVVITLIIIGLFLTAESWVNQQFGSLTSSGGEILKAFILGIIASVSTCAALTGGIILSLAEKWRAAFINKPLWIRAVPHMNFHIGRLISFTISGLLLGAIGSAALISYELKSLLTIGIAFVMLILGLQLLNVGWATRIRLTLPKSLNRKATQATSVGAFLTGISTVLLPCSLTLYAFSMAITAGATGALVTLGFALGSLPVLAAISLTSLIMQQKSFTSAKFNLVAGLLVIFFALYSINNQLNALGLISLNDLLIR